MTRVERLAELIKEEVSKIIRQEVSDPRIGFTSITRVDVSPDLKNASIFVSILDSEAKKKECMQGLASATGFIRSKLGQMLELRLVPAIKFVKDDSLERGSRVLSIISRLEKEEREKNTVRHRKSRKKR